MIGALSNYYKQKGFNRVYIATNTEGRKVATLRRADKTMTSMSYAKYLYTSHYECDVEKGMQVDHINGNKTDDRIENLQVISERYNKQKDHTRAEYVLLVCPVCGKEFILPKRNYIINRNHCCSRRCGGIKSHWIK